MQQINVPPKPKEEVEIPLDDIVGAKVEKLKILQTQIITIENKENICEELETISSVIQDIHAMEEKEPRHFNELKFEYNNVKLLYQRYEIEEEITALKVNNFGVTFDEVLLMKEHYRSEIARTREEELSLRKEIRVAESILREIEEEDRDIDKIEEKEIVRDEQPRL